MSGCPHSFRVCPMKLYGTLVSKQYSVQCTVHSVHCTVYNVQSSVYSVQCTVYSVQCTVYSVQCTMYSVQYSVDHSTLYSVCRCCAAVTPPLSGELQSVGSRPPGRQEGRQEGSHALNTPFHTCFLRTKFHKFLKETRITRE